MARDDDMRSSLTPTTLVIRDAASSGAGASAGASASASGEASAGAGASASAGADAGADANADANADTGADSAGASAVAVASVDAEGSPAAVVVPATIATTAQRSTTVLESSVTLQTQNSLAASLNLPDIPTTSLTQVSSSPSPTSTLWIGRNFTFTVSVLPSTEIASATPRESAPTTSTSPRGSLSISAIVGIAIGAMTLLALVAALWLRSRWKRFQAHNRTLQADRNGLRASSAADNDYGIISTSVREMDAIVPFLEVAPAVWPERRGRTEAKMHSNTMLSSPLYASNLRIASLAAWRGQGQEQGQVTSSVELAQSRVSGLRPLSGETVLERIARHVMRTSSSFGGPPGGAELPPYDIVELPPGYAAQERSQVV